MRLYALLFVIGLVAYGGLAAKRVFSPSAAPQFVVQADSWLHGKLSVTPTKTDADWSKVETVELRDRPGELVQGRRMITRPFFHPLRGAEIPNAQIGGTREVTWYMSFPPFPTVIMLPSAIISGRDGNDVLPTILFAALILPLSLLVLRRLAAAQLSQRSLGDDLWLVAMLAFGSVMFFSAVQGSVWYTAHVVGVVLALIYAWGSIEAKRPIIAGLALGAAALTRTPMAFMFPLFLAEAWRMAGGDRRTFVRGVVPFAIPVAAFAIAGMAYNIVRFHSPTEFGHTYLDVRQQAQIEQWGLASYHYLTRNLAVAFTLLPELPGHWPWIQISGHGLALWLTTPILLYALWPTQKPAIHRALWITVACVAIPSLFYQNSGWVQFGYRFSLDYMVFLMMLLAIGGRRFGWLARGLIIVGILINLFGAYTFNRSGQYYHYNYDVVVAH
ncbi:MAG TPA: hypothetical protein VMZ53_13495 [Kofleriaceae bacterium]|nr:hypothetical protein [Kofleriaceae bacterium]